MHTTTIPYPHTLSYTLHTTTTTTLITNTQQWREVQLRELNLRLESLHGA